MMVIPRSYAQALPRRVKSTEFNEKTSVRRTRSPSNPKKLRTSASTSLFRVKEASPVKTESRNAKIQPQSPVQEPKDAPIRPPPVPLAPNPEKHSRFRRESTKDLLSSTAIPIRKKPRGRPSQRLPKGDHVANFSTLLMDDIRPSSSSMQRSSSNSNFETLFGNMDELLEDGQMFVGSGELESGVLSARSMSDASLPSMTLPDDYTPDDHASQNSYTSPSPPEKRLRQLATSEDCSDDHPLAQLREEDDVFNTSPQLNPISPTLRPTLPTKSERKPRQSLTSSLTASLKALKQTVSHRANSVPSGLLTNSFFDFHPNFTDDIRPPPSLDTSNAELRRYLNPPPLDSAAQLHFWQDHRHSKFDTKPALEREPRRRSKSKHSKSPNRNAMRSPSPPGSHPLIRDLPPVVQLANCLPSSIRTEHASSPPIWLASDGTPINKNTAITLLYDPNANDGKGEPVGMRHREPRENRDFLRVFVCEMDMRRHGKLSEDLGAGRARLWLPPVSTDPGNKFKTPRKEGEVIVTPPSPNEALIRKKRPAGERLRCLSVGDV